MTPISRSEPAAGKRHFSVSRPALDLSRAISPRLWRVPRTSRLYIGQSFASCALATARGTMAETTASATPIKPLFIALQNMRLLRVAHHRPDSVLNPVAWVGRDDRLGTRVIRNGGRVLSPGIRKCC